jgi:hypothetical protein
MEAKPHIVEAGWGRWCACRFTRLCLLGLFCLAGFGEDTAAAAAAEVMVPQAYQENVWRGEAELAGRRYAFEVLPYA